MKSSGLTPFLVLAGVVGLGVFLYFTSYTPLAKETEMTAEAAAPVAVYDIALDLSEARNAMDSTTLAGLAQLETETTVKGEAALDSIMAMYDNMRQPAAAAYTAIKKAEKWPTAKNYGDAGERYLLCARFLGEEPQRKAWFEVAKTNLEKAVALDPKDLDIKVNLGVCLVEGATLLGQPPMAGIGMLKEVEQLDPTNVNALLNLGYFSIRSGQYDKAEERFNQVVKLKPELAETHLYLADLHERAQRFQDAIIDLENYLKLINDPQKETEVRSYIEKLKSNLKH